MRQTAEFAQWLRKRLRREAHGARQRACSQRIRRVVHPVNRQLVERQDRRLTLDEMTLDHPEIHHPGRSVEPEGHPRAAGPGERHDARIVPVEHLDTFAHDQRVTQTWRGRPLVDRMAAIELIAATTTKAGRKVASALEAGANVGSI